MIDEFNENLGKNPFVTLEEVKEYLVIKNRSEYEDDGVTIVPAEKEKNDRIRAIIKYATGAVEHYIGQEVLANTYTEVTIGDETRRLHTSAPANRGAFGNIFVLTGTDELSSTGFQTRIRDFPVSKFVKRIPLKEVYEVRNIDLDGSVTIFKDSTILGAPVYSDDPALTFSIVNGKITDKITRFGKSCAKTPHLTATSDSRFMFEEGDFTIEMQVRIDDDNKCTDANAAVITLSDAANTTNLALGISLEKGIFIGGSEIRKFNRENEITDETDTFSSATIVTVPIDNKHVTHYNKSSYTAKGVSYHTLTASYTLINPKKRQWEHIALTRNLQKDEMYVHLNGNLMNRNTSSMTSLTVDSAEYKKFESNNAAFGLDRVTSPTSNTIHLASVTNSSNVVVYASTTKDIDFNPASTEHNYNNILIGGCQDRTIYIDEVRISDTARYTSSDFTPPAERFRPDNDTNILLHFDETANNSVEDASKAKSEYMFSRDVGQILFINDANIETKQQYKQIKYRAGYEKDEVPEDLKLATLDFIKMLYKQDQDIQRGSLNGDQRAGFALVRNFPAHIKRILDFYRISGTGAQ